MFGKINLMLAAVCMSCIICAQPVPSFTNFKGKVYEIPFKLLKKGYGPHIYEYDEIGEIDWKEINVPDTETSEAFPDVSRKTRFGMVLHSEVTIDLVACYEFSLNSDDGSLLWINEKLIVNNKGDHQMQLVRDTVELEAGTYPAKLWYHQAYPDRFGFIFDYKYAGPPGSCEKKVEPEIVKETITLNSSLLFDYNSWTVTDDTIEELNTFINKIQNKNPEKITIIGYTDDSGTEEYNLKLSKKRADMIMEVLQKKLKPGIAYVTKGLGETNPIADNSTEEGREKNRRVTIKIE